MKVNYAAGAASDGLLKASGGRSFIGKNATTTRERRRQRERRLLKQAQQPKQDKPSKGFQ